MVMSEAAELQQPECAGDASRRKWMETGAKKDDVGLGQMYSGVCVCVCRGGLDGIWGVWVGGSCRASVVGD